MKFTAIAIATVIALAGCSSARKATVESAPIEALNAQKLSSSFKRQGIKIACIEEDCLSNGFINVDQYKTIIEKTPKSEYRNYLESIL
jgi:dTDP-glucose pyrophosphorylase